MANAVPTALEVRIDLTSSATALANERSSGAPDRVEVLGMPLHVVRFEEALERLVQLARGDRPAYAVTANVDHVVRLCRNPELLRLYADADLSVADGMPVVWASRLLGVPLPERVAGSDLFPALCAKAAQHGLSVFFLGGAPGTAQRAAEILQTRHPPLRVAGTYCPEYGFERDPAASERALQAVRAAAPDILFVGLGSPKQENWIAANRAACRAKLSIGVGISFSFISGHVPRAPRWMQRIGLEWCHRLVQEPGRLWKRYLIDDAAFLGRVLRELFTRPRQTHKRSSVEPTMTEQSRLPE